MEITAALAADLALLDDALYDPVTDLVPDVAGTVLALAAYARAAVSSFLGLTITATRAAHEAGAAEQVLLRFTLLDDHADPCEVESTLRLPRPVDGAAPDQPSIAVVLHATTPGAFVDLAADVGFSSGRAVDATDLDRHRGSAREPDITGVLRSETTIHEAVGVLIARGRTREAANVEIDTLAAAAHTDRRTEAHRILTGLARGGPESPTLAAPGDLA